ELLRVGVGAVAERHLHTGGAAGLAELGERGRVGEALALLGRGADAVGVQQHAHARPRRLSGGREPGNPHGGRGDELAAGEHGKPPYPKGRTNHRVTESTEKKKTEKNRCELISACSLPLLPLCPL